MRELAAFAMRSERGIAGPIAALDHKIRATGGFSLQRLGGGRQQHQGFGVPGQPAFRKASMLAQPAQRTKQGIIIGFAHNRSLRDQMRVRQKPSVEPTARLGQARRLPAFPAGGLAIVAFLRDVSRRLIPDPVHFR